MPDPMVLAAVFSRWETLVGTEISEHAKPRSLHEGTLILEVDHPAWASQLRFMSEELIASINSATKPGLVETLKVVVARSEEVARYPRRSFDAPL
jgi:predicted nucleic acid-binding Zn ribbon protein